MSKDMCVACDNGILNVRVGAIIMKDDKVLMVGDGLGTYLYSVGGRIKFGETAEEAIVREVLEETGVELEIDRLGFVYENYFYGKSPSNLGKLVYELSLYFYMKVSSDFEPVCKSVTEDNNKEYLKWVPLDTEITMHPNFFREELKHPTNTIKHLVNDER